MPAKIGKLNLNVYDTAGQENFQDIRRANMDGSDVLIICYSCHDKISLSNIKSKWVPELTQGEKKYPFLIVGNKSDLYVKGDDLGVSPELAAKVCKSFGLKKKQNLRCSAKEWGDTQGTKGNIKSVFMAAIRMGLLARGIIKETSVIEELCTLL